MINSILYTTVVFVLISMFLPGFKVSGSKLNYLWLAIGYMVLVFLGKLLVVVPLAAVLNSLLSLIPILGGMIMTLSRFLATFFISIVMLLALDATMKDFKLSGYTPAFIASLILGFVGCL